MLTFWDWQEPNQDECILMSSLQVIMYVSNREVHQVVLMLAGPNRSNRFITAKYDRDKHRSMCVWCHEIRFSRLISCFTISSVLFGLIILTFFLQTTFLILILSLISHQRREPRTTKDGISRGQPTQTGLRYDLRLPKILNPPVCTELGWRPTTQRPHVLPHWPRKSGPDGP